MRRHHAVGATRCPVHQGRSTLADFRDRARIADKAVGLEALPAEVKGKPLRLRLWGCQGTIPALRAEA